MIRRSSCIVIILLFGITTALSQIPQTLSYQGIFSDATGNLLNGSYDLTFKIYNQETGGNLLCTAPARLARPTNLKGHRRLCGLDR